MPATETPHAPGEVPDGFVVVRGGTGSLPTPGTPFSASAGVDLVDAAKGVPHGSIRHTTAGELRRRGGYVVVAPEPTRSGVTNGRHVTVVEGEQGSFSDVEPNPIPKANRVV